VAQTKTEIQSLLADAGTEPRHRFGQNFMIDQNLVRLVAAAGEIVAGDVIIEVGPGTGTLTEELLASPAARVVAVEIDRNLSQLLREKFDGNDRFHLIEADALSSKHELNEDLAAVIRAARSPVKLIANLPYNIASPLVIDLLLGGVGALVFTVQKEVADRLRAAPDTDAYGPLSVIAQLLAKVEVLRTLAPQAFWPAPKIESCLVRMIGDDQLAGRGREFGKFIQQIFSLRRKTLRKAMTMTGWPAERLLATTQIDGHRRPGELSPAELVRLFEASMVDPPRCVP
jgi:16S rRNA (adenine1518-N6/adenine1519-N6)-dimethyltransferase